MIARALVWGAWVAAALFGVAAALRVRDSRREILRLGVPAALPAVEVVPAELSADSIDEAAALAIDYNLFRSDRTSVDTNVAAVGSGPPRPVAAPPATIMVRGILGGPPWTVVLQGVPGAPNPVVLRVGDTIAGFFLVRVKRDTVVVRGAGSTLTLPWAAR